MKKLIKDKEGKIQKVVTVYSKPSKTQQQFKDETNVNKIIAKYTQTGELQHLRKNKGVFADMSNLGSYQESLNLVLKANQSFSELNAQTRNRFGNDPQQLIDFLADDSNRDEAVKLGLIIEKEKKPVDPPQETQPKPDPKT